jgi:hypothetical protein
MVTRVRHYVDEENVVDDTEVVHRSVARAPWSPAQVVALIVGAIFAILGGVALARTGVNFSNIASTHTSVGGMHHTALLGLIELVLGLFLIGAGAIPGGARGAMTFFGVLTLGFGIVVMISTDSFSMHKWLGVHTGNGWFFVVMGAILLVTAMVSPVFFGSDRRAVARRTEVIER